MKVLVTGGAGFIGSHLVKRLMSSGHTVTVIDNLSSGYRHNLPKGMDIVSIDLSKPDFIGQMPSADYDAVCHLAAQSSGQVSDENPLYSMSANAGSTLLLSRWCVANKIQRFLYASSMVIYGHARNVPVKESAACEPLQYYGVSKLMSEHFLRLASRDGLRSTSLRMFSVFGPGQDLDNLKQGMVSIFLAYMLRRQDVPVKGSFDRFRDFIYIDDVVDVWMAALERPSTPLPAYNVGSGRPTTVRALLAALRTAFKLPEDYPIHEEPGSPSDQFGLYADISQTQTDLGWKPRTPFEEGIQKMVAWAGCRQPTR